MIDHRGNQNSRVLQHGLPVQPGHGFRGTLVDGQEAALAVQPLIKGMPRLPHPIPYQGSKRRLAPAIATYLPKSIETFYEPFAGSAALTIHVARYRLARRFVLADSLAPLVELLRSIVEAPERTSADYRRVWNGQRDGDRNYYLEIRERYNRQRNPVDLLYLICRCAKNAIRFSSGGRFSQSADKRRLGMHPDKMAAAILGVSYILQGNAEFRVGDWRETVADARPQDFVYMDPPYLGTSIGRDKRYHAQLAPEELVVGLSDLRRRGVPFALSYDGRTGVREYGSPLPAALGLTQILLHAGRSSQATLLGRHEETIESLYLTPGLAGPDANAPSLEGTEADLLF